MFKFIESNVAILALPLKTKILLHSRGKLYLDCLIVRSFLINGLWFSVLIFSLSCFMIEELLDDTFTLLINEGFRFVTNEFLLIIWGLCVERLVNEFKNLAEKPSANFS